MGISNFSLKYFIPFKAEDGSGDLALKEKLINIEGVAIDTSVNSNKWQVPEEDLDFLVQSLNGAQLRVDHAESALMVVGKVSAASRNGSQVLFRAEVGEEKLIEKILRNYVSHVSIQVDSDDVECSMCQQPTRSEGLLIHLCPDAWEIVRKPKVRELSIVASPAYRDTKFQPIGFGSAMNQSQVQRVDKATQGLLDQLQNLKFLLKKRQEQAEKVKAMHELKDKDLLLAQIKNLKILVRRRQEQAARAKSSKKPRQEAVVADFLAEALETYGSSNPQSFLLDKEAFAALREQYLARVLKS